MSSKKGRLLYENDTNQLPYSGTPGQYYNWELAFAKTLSGTNIDTSFGEAYPVTKFSASWPALDKSYSPIYSRFRLRNESLNSNSFWSVPNVLYSQPRYAIYKRKVAYEPTPWILAEVTVENQFNDWIEDWTGRVQYAICIYHKDGYPQPLDGYYSQFSNFFGVYVPKYLKNSYVLFMSDRLDIRMKTRPYINYNVNEPPDPGGDIGI